MNTNLTFCYSDRSYPNVLIFREIQIKRGAKITPLNKKNSVQHWLLNGTVLKS
ncbi:MAG: hypothetical protein FD181_2671 [Prolixibacteraceae bacterium]|nr:MAG: hypothetical protein FD181_2671 [Prolixibacteraceae bacterium]